MYKYIFIYVPIKVNVSHWWAIGGVSDGAARDAAGDATIYFVSDAAIRFASGAAGGAADGAAGGAAAAPPPRCCRRHRRRLQHLVIHCHILSTYSHDSWLWGIAALLWRR